MQKTSIAFLIIMTCLTFTVQAADDGQTQPRINYANNNAHLTAVDIIATTNGTGNVKGVHCRFLPDAYGLSPTALVKFTVNGGSVQSVTIDNGVLPAFSDGSALIGYSGWVPFNIRFTSSIRVQIQKGTSWGQEVQCAVSWALD